MSLSLGQTLKIRAMIYVAAEPVPFFWPMRSFIHHNPLHGLEHMPFAEAVEKGGKIFHGRTFLPRYDYQRYLKTGDVDVNSLEFSVDQYLAQINFTADVNLKKWIMSLLTQQTSVVVNPLTVASVADVKSTLNNQSLASASDLSDEKLCEILQNELLGEHLVYESVDALYGTDIGNDLDDLVIKSCLDFFDEGQSVWGMPERRQGFFSAWREVATRNVRLFLRGMHINHILAVDDSPEGVIAHVMETLGVSEDHWIAYFTNEIARLHGWAGFIRWRSSSKQYYWHKRYPADLVDFVAIRLALGLALLQQSGRRDLASTGNAISRIIKTSPKETFLRHEFYTGKVIPALAHEVEMCLQSRSPVRLEKVFSKYIATKRHYESRTLANRLSDLARSVGESESLKQLSVEELDELVAALKAFEKQEGMHWLRAMESKAMAILTQGINLAPTQSRDKRPFVQALFCIDTRSERIRRHLESVGDYQTYGIAGFFGVPVSFMELGKGSENHLSPVIVTPKNLVLEMSTDEQQYDPTAVTTIEKVFHELKESILSPFVTVEAIGLLFGFDMVGKTIAPRAYNIWRKQVQPDRSHTRLLLDKLSREQADSIIRTVQRAVIIKAAEQELGLAPENINDNIVRQFRDGAMQLSDASDDLPEISGIDKSRVHAFISRLHKTYRINPSFAQVQLEQLGRIGFTVDEQAHFVSQALFAIGLTKEFSRFILLVGHGSTSDNNPYESALDCGACGGNHGLVNARVIAQMGNKPEVRAKLRDLGVDIAEDAWFIPALHNTTTDEIRMHDLDLVPASHLVYLDRLRNGLTAASRLCTQERIPTLQCQVNTHGPDSAFDVAQRNAIDWSQVRPEWGLSRNAYFIIGRRALTEQFPLEGRAFLHSYDYLVDPKQRILENILTGPLVVGQWINMEHYFSAVDNERFGSSSKAYHNVAGRFGVMSGNLSDLRTGLPSQTVLENGRPYHQPVRLITLIEAPFEHAKIAVEAVVAVKNLVRNGWIRLMISDPRTNILHIYDDGEWHQQPHHPTSETLLPRESTQP